VVRGYFVTGTDTGVGKTVASAALMHRLRCGGPIRYWKPIQTGIESDDDTATVERLGGCTADELWRPGVRLERPVSPHLAARLAGTRIDVAAVARLLPDDRSARWIVEGAGGALVPVNESELMTDLMARLALPVIVVSRSTLGTINHTLLTIEAARAAGLQVAVVVLTPWPDSPSAIEESNRETIAELGEVRVETLPRLDLEDPGSWPGSPRPPRR